MRFVAGPEIAIEALEKTLAGAELSGNVKFCSIAS
jgi:hypothetical protein